MDLRTRWFANAALAALVGVLVLAVVLPDEPPANPAAVHEVIPGLADARTLTVTNRHGSVSFAREGADTAWQMTAPFQAPADAGILTTLLDGLAKPSDARYPVAEVALEAAGLVTPATTLTVDGETYAFGGTAPISYKRYLRHGDAVFMVEEINHYRLDQPATYFVRRKLLPDDAAVTRIELPGRSLTLADGRWTLSPEDSGVSADAIEKLVAAWREATAIEVRALTADAAVAERVRITLADGRVLEFGIQTSDQYTRLARADQGLTYELLSNARKQLLELARSDPDAALAPAGD